MTMSEVYVLLVHSPVTGADGAEITTAITPMDISDIARTCRTYNVKGYGIVQPEANQRALVNRLRNYWMKKGYLQSVRSRHEALERIETFSSVEDAYRAWGEGCIMVTSALAGEGSNSWDELRKETQQRRTYILFGTGYGLAPRLMESADRVIPAIQAGNDYAHLSVRAAVAIILDRILGEKR